MGANQRARHAALLEEVWDYRGWPALQNFFPIHDSLIARLKEGESSPNRCWPLHRNFLCPHPNIS